MAGSAVYGFVLGMAFVLVARAAPQPGGSLIWWTFLAVQLTWGATICWRRTGLPYATASMGIGAAISACLAILAATGRVFPDLPLAWWIIVGIGFATGPLFLFIESRAHRDKWQRWADYMERKNAWDIFTGRHIPRLRDDGAHVAPSLLARGDRRERGPSS